MTTKCTNCEAKLKGIHDTHTAHVICKGPICGNCNNLEIAARLKQFQSK